VLPALTREYEPKDTVILMSMGCFLTCSQSKPMPNGGTCHGHKRSKDRITVLTCANIDGIEKLALLVTGKSQKPRCLKNVKSLPYTYRHNSSAQPVQCLKNF
jgi:hypothetical protein